MYVLSCAAHQQLGHLAGRHRLEEYEVRGQQRLQDQLLGDVQAQGQAERPGARGLGSQRHKAGEADRGSTEGVAGVQARCGPACHSGQHLAGQAEGCR